MTATALAKRPPRPVVLLRPVPGRSAIHELWAGTKLIVVAVISALLTVNPGWVPIGLAAVLLAVAVRIAHIPRGALPSAPRWLWMVLLIGGAITALAGGDPVVNVGSVALGLGGLSNFLRFTALTVVLLGLGAMVSWTTNVAEVAPAVSTLGRPLRWLRIPIDDWSAALALALRAFPMLIDEFRVLFASRRLRPKQIARTRLDRLRRRVSELVDLMVAIVTVALRRADEMGDAITVRGGIGQLSAAQVRPKSADWVVLSIVLVVCGAAVAAKLVWGG